MPEQTPQLGTSSGVAGVVSTLVSIAGVIETKYPGAIPIVGQILNLEPTVRAVVPTVLAVGGAIYAAASSSVPWLRKLFPWKKERIHIA